MSIFRIVLRIVSVALLMAGSAAGPAVAGIEQWTSHGPEGGDVVAVVIDPSASEIVYVVAQNLSGAFKSTDRGITWRRMDLPRNQQVTALVIDPKAPSTLYATILQAGIFKSTDRGETWRHLSLLDRPVSLAIDPVTPSTLYAGTVAGTVFRSTDAGLRWTSTGAAFGDTWVPALGIDPRKPSTVYAGSSDGLFKSTDRGRTWISLAEGPWSVMSAQALVVAPGVLYVADASRGVFKSTNGGVSWTLLLPSQGAFAMLLTVDPSNPGTLYAGTTINGILRSRDGGLTWKRVGPDDENIASLAVDPASPSILYAGVYGRGIYRSTDGARTWTAANTGLLAVPVWALTIDPTNPSILYAASWIGASFKTTDGGLSWSPMNLGGRTGGFSALAVAPRNPKTVYAAVSDGVFKSLDGGQQWRYSGLGAPYAPCSLAIDPVVPSIVYAGTCGAGVFKSTDGGASWKPSNEGLDDVIVWALAIDPQSPSTLYAATAGRGVYKSLDEGQTWFPANTGLSSSPQGVEAIVIDPTNTSLLHACDAWIGMVRSTDAGEHWTVVEVNEASFFCTSLAITATSPPTLYAGSVGVIQSQDGGTSWTALNDGLTNSLVKALAVDPAGSTVHAGTMVDGVFDYTTAPPAPCVASATTACLHGGRYAVRATYATSDRSLDAAHVMQLTDDSTAFWFFLPANLEAFLKVIDGCSVNGHIWVFAAGLTDVEAGLFVTDTQSGIVRSYFNPSRTPFEPAQDIRAFACDTPPPSPASPRRASAAPPGGGMEAPAAGTCRPNATTLCLGNGRFAVNTTFRTPFGLTGQGMAVPLTFDTGYFWFFDAANLEVMVKVLDACSLFGRFWVFAGGLTNLEVTTTVTDTLTGYSKSYVNPWGTAFRPVQDTGFLACAAHAPRAAPVPRRPMVP